MWKDQYNTYGFQVTFTPEVPKTIGLYPETHMFGTMDKDDNFETLEIDYQLSSLGICVDTEHQRDKFSDFEGFQFINSEGDIQTLSPDCQGEFIQFDLTTRALLGFSVVTSDFTNGYRNIRKICPIVQNLCLSATIEIDQLNDMHHQVGTGDHE